MDINFNRIDPNRQVGSVDRSKRVQKPNKDEAEQNGKRFKDQLDLASQTDNEEESKEKKEKKKTSPPDTGENVDRKKLGNDKDIPGDDEGTLGTNLDITV
ncbi:MAG: hypothetical protein K9N46_07270 [Candidatus Marinimicrobia bacterium]|nr:hypothetical protein [Candidatus Neomarinimicrobiota bacterium]MCF7880522.1 hypothetical protein [Candidatus Neomarinimicrobiota bacterium]